MDSVSRFTATVDDYVKYRPNYPAELFAFLSSTYAPGAIVADIGAGTGIFTRQLAEQPYVSKVYAVEPNDTMRQAAEAHESPARSKIAYVKGTAERSGLPAGSVDGVLGAQCFHWFDLALALPELNRITKPGSTCCAIWNDRSGVGFNVDLEAILMTHSRPYTTLRRPDSTIRDLHNHIPHGEEICFDYEQVLDLDGIIGRMASTSYVAHGVDDKIMFNHALTEAFNKHQRHGNITIHYKTRVFYWATPRALM